MNPGEHETMARVESRHWWYRGLHDLVTRILAEPPLRPPPGARVLDAGCGTGGVLRLLGERLQPTYLGGFDQAAEAVALAARAVPGADVYVSDLCDPEIRSNELDLVVSLDVLCIPGVAHAREGLRRLAGQLRPGGLLILNLPAYRWLYSEHDAAVHTSERYTAREVRALLAELGLEPVILSYRLCLLLPLVVLARLPRLRRVAPGDPVARSDLHAEPGRLMNRLLLAVLRLENRGIARGVRLPFGSSVFAVARKPR